MTGNLFLFTFKKKVCTYFYWNSFFFQHIFFCAVVQLKDSLFFYLLNVHIYLTTMVKNMHFLLISTPKLSSHVDFTIITWMNNTHKKSISGFSRKPYIFYSFLYQRTYMSNNKLINFLSVVCNFMHFTSFSTAPKQTQMNSNKKKRKKET